MNVNAIPFKRIKVTGVTALVLIAGLYSCEYKAAQSSFAPNTQFTPQIQPSSYGVLTAKITSKDSGVASVNLDGFTLDFDFKYSAHKDDYGVPGSDFIAVDITELGEISAKDANGNPYKDFTDYIDHRNINALLKGFIEKNRLVEA